MAKHTVVRTDLMEGTNVASKLVSLRLYDGEAKTANKIDCDNGTLVTLGGYEEDEREVRHAELATAEAEVTECVLVATPEVMYDERQKNLDEFYNEAGTIARGYYLQSKDYFSITKEGFVGGTVPSAAETSVGIGAGGKIDASGSGLGTVRAIEQTSRYTYYVIQID